MRSIIMIAALAGCRYGFELRALGTESDAASADTSDTEVVPGWSSIIAGDQTTCGIYQGSGYCWGRGTNYEIGDGQGMNRNVPTKIPLPAGTVTALSQGEGHGCAIVDSKAYCWGNTPPGNGSTTSMLPIAVNGLPTPVTSIACGGGFTCAVAANVAYCWGSDSGGALGNGVTSGTLLMPNMVTLPASPVAVDAGNDHAFALLSSGAVYGWGHNDGPGALCTGANTNTYDAPVLSLISGVLPSLAGWHACALVGGTAQCWGLGNSGELGDGLSTTSNTPRNVSGLGAGVRTIVTGGGPADLDATCAADSAGAVSCWGSGTFGRLGNGSNVNEPLPYAVSGVSDVVELALGYDHTCARSADGSLRCWGRGNLGQLGDGAGANSLAPVLVPLP